MNTTVLNKGCSETQKPTLPIILRNADDTSWVMLGSTFHIHSFQLVWGWCNLHTSSINISNIPKDADSLLKFFILLATASETDLGFDINIKRVSKTDYNIQFTIEGKGYCASLLLSDIGVNTLSGQGHGVWGNWWRDNEGTHHQEVLDWRPSRKTNGTSNCGGNQGWYGPSTPPILPHLPLPW